MKGVAFLRAINVGGRVVKMDKLRALFEKAGFTGVETFIASGNVVFEISAASKGPSLEEKIEAMLRDALGYEVAALVRTGVELKAVAEHEPFTPAQLKRAFTVNVAFLRQAPDANAVKALEAARQPTDTFHMRGRELYWLSTIGQGQSKTSNAVFEKTLGMHSTLRGITTIRKMAEKFGVLALCVLALTAQTRAPKTYRLEATPSTVAYGYYWAEAPPVLRIQSGDIIDVDTLLTNTPMGLERAGVPQEKIQESLKKIVGEVTGDRRGPGGHILTGPVFVEGAEPGDVLEVKVLSIDFAIDYGYNGCAGFLPENCDRTVPAKIISIDRKKMTAEFKPGIVIPLHPFFGSMGVAPAPAAGRVSSNPPGRHAGNLDNKELVAGTTLFIPVFTRGALFEIGDGHGAQGDGEVDQTAIETSLRGRVQLTVRTDMKLQWPRAETSTDFISMAADPDLKIATSTAIQEMVDFLVASKHLSRHEAYQLVSIAGNVAVTQLVDRPNVGVHVRLPKSIFR